MVDLDIRWRWRVAGLTFVACAAAGIASAQQQVPPKPDAALAKPALKISAMTERAVVHADAVKAQIFRGTALSDAQKQSIMSNLAGVGLSQQTAPKTMQQFIGPVPPAEASGMACIVNYAGTTAELIALRKTVAGLVAKNKPRTCRRSSRAFRRIVPTRSCTTTSICWPSSRRSSRWPSVQGVAWRDMLPRRSCSSA